MMIECPRCGFAQPKDQFCASCGLNIDQYLARPKSIWLRILQNPNLHLSLIGILVALVIGWIFYTQRGLVGQEMSTLLDLPVSSKDAGAPDERDDTQKAESAAAAREVHQPESAPAQPQPEAAIAANAAIADPNVPQAQGADVAAPAAAAAAAGTGGAPAPNAASGGPRTKLEVSVWEVPREALSAALSGGERAGEGNGGRALYFAQGAKVIETLTNRGLSVAGPRSSGLNTGSQVIFESPPAGTEAFNFLLQVDVTKAEGGALTVRWENNLILPQTNAEPGAAPSPLTENTLMGTIAMAPAGVVLLIMEPVNRAPNEQYFNKAGEGPWSVLASQEFRGGLTDWVAVIQLK